MKEIQKVEFDSDLEITLKAVLTKDFFLHAKKNSKNVNVYRIKYISNKHLVAGFIVEPKSIKTKLPVIIANRGGNRNFADFRLGRVFTELADMAQWGYIVFASQLSGYENSEGKDEFGGRELKDILNLHKIIQAHPKADAKRIGMIGHSRGGMMTYLCLAKVRWIKAAISVAVLANLERSAQERPDLATIYKELFDVNKKEVEKRSSVCWPEKFSKKTPLLLMHGTTDWRVSPLDSLELSTKLYEKRVPHRLILFEGDDHMLSSHKKEVTDQIHAWFDRFLKRGEALPNLKPHGR